MRGPSFCGAAVLFIGLRMDRLPCVTEDLGH